MTSLIKVTFTSTSGEEVNGHAQYDPAAGMVTLPARLLELVNRATGAGEGYAIVAHEDGYRIPLLHVENGSYRVDRARRQHEALLLQAWKAVIAPTKDQRQQSGRFAHTLSAAAVIGAAGYVGSGRVWTLSAVTDVLSLVGIGVVLFFVGAVLSKGD